MVNCKNAEVQEVKIYGRLTKVYVCKKFNGAKCNEIFQKRCPYHEEVDNGSRNATIDTQSTGE